MLLCNSSELQNGHVPTTELLVLLQVVQQHQGFWIHHTQQWWRGPLRSPGTASQLFLVLVSPVYLHQPVGCFTPPSSPRSGSLMLTGINTGRTRQHLRCCMQTSILTNGFRSLAEGEEVEFVVEQGGNGRLQATSVTGPNGAPPQVLPSLMLPTLCTGHSCMQASWSNPFKSRVSRLPHCTSQPSSCRDRLA